MGDAIGSMLASAVGIAISPAALIAVVLLLATPRGRTNGPAFAAGWVVGLSGVVGMVVAAGTGLGGGSGRPTWAFWLRLALGGVLVLLAARQWRARPRAGHVTPPPRWMQAVDRFTAGRSFGLAVTLVVAKPKNLALAVGGAASVAASGAGPGGTAVAAALMVVIGSLCTLLPLGVGLLGGSGAARLLGEWKAWTGAHNAAVTATVSAVLGVAYLGDALTGLS
ncbi:GAP family protein [Kitasatospora sp. NPDC085879]|uniref:GAP family protein n=1 Tax=Kitasatospora sp. NPDC085879 TaxID=3154769 RepID=UPI0034203D98